MGMSDMGGIVSEAHLLFFFFTVPAATEIYTLSLHDALPISGCPLGTGRGSTSSYMAVILGPYCPHRSEEHTSELQSLRHLVCRILHEKKKIDIQNDTSATNNYGITAPNGVETVT